MTTENQLPRKAVLCSQSWAGRTEAPVIVIKETTKRYRIKAAAGRVKVGRGGFIQGDETALVPKYAVRFSKW